MLYLMYCTEKPEEVNLILWSDNKVKDELSKLLNRLSNYRNNRSYRFPGNHAKYGQELMELAAFLKIAEVRRNIEGEDVFYKTLFTKSGAWLGMLKRESKMIGLMFTQMRQTELFDKITSAEFVGS